MVQEGYYILLKLEGKKCVVIGGSSAATRKVDALRRCGADVHIIADSFCEALMRRTDITLHQKPYEKKDLEGASLVLICTDDEPLIEKVINDCKELGILYTVADRPEISDFTVPAVLKRGPIQIAVGTGGSSPYLEGRIRDLIAGWLDRAYEPFAYRLADLRPLIIERIPDADERRALFQKLAGRESFDRFKREGSDAWCEWVSQKTAGRITPQEAIEITKPKPRRFTPPEQKIETQKNQKALK